MASIVISGDTSGTVTLAAPTVAGTQSYTLPTAVPAANGYALTSTTGGVMSWAAASATPGGSTTQVQYNSSGAFAGSANMTFNGTSLTLGADATVNSITVGRGGSALNTCVAVGRSAGAASTSATDGSTAIGNLALQSVTGVANTAIGSAAGGGITTGTVNTCVGVSAGYYPTALTTGTKCIFIGVNTSPSAAGGIYQIVIGNDLVGKGDNTAFIGGTSGAYNGANSASWSITSDQRIKKNVVNVGNSLEKINALRVVEFDYKENDKHETGFIAQEFQQVFPEQITTHDPNAAEKEWVGEDKVLGIQQNLVPFLVKAIQELSAANEALTARIAALEAK